MSSANLGERFWLFESFLKDAAARRAAAISPMLALWNE